MSHVEGGLPASFVVECPECRAPLAVRSDLPFRAARCPLCSGEFLIPKPEAPPVQSPPAPTGMSAPPPPRQHEVPSFSMPEPPAGSQSPAPLPATPARRTAELDFQEPVATIETAAGRVPLRRMSPEEKQARRTRRNLIMLCGGATILFLIVLLLGRDKKRRS
jgi:hypothetical protein